MPYPTRNGTQLTLARSLFGYVLVTLALVLVLGIGFTLSRADPLINEVLDRAVKLRTASSAMEIARTLDEDWRDLDYLALRAAEASPENLRGLIDGMRGDGARIAWIGFVNVDGEVLNASGGMLLGKDVSERLWFRGGLNGGFAGDVHDAVTLQGVPAGDGSDPLRLVDLSRPVLNAAGEVIGVVAMQIDFGWLSAHLTETARSLGIDLYLIGADGTVITATTKDRPDASELRILRAAQTGSQAAARETWPDGREYFSTLVPQVTYNSLPNFSWRMIGRLPADAFKPNIAIVQRGAVLAGIGMVLVLVAVTLLYIRIFLRPVARLASSAGRIAEGSDEYPPSSTVTRETAELSAALVRLQEARSS